MKRITLFLIGMLFLQHANAQSEAELLLESVYNQIRSYENISLDFNYSLYNELADIRQETTGSIVLKDSLYQFEFMGIQQLFNGSKVITVIKENEEVTIVDKSDDQESISPSNLFDFYREGYTYQMDIKQQTPEGSVQYVKLTPIDSNSEMNYLLLGVLVDQLQIYKLIQKGNNRTETTFKVTDFTTDIELNDGMFKFDRATYEELGYYIIED